MRIHEVLHVTHEFDLLEAHLMEHASFVDKFFVKHCPVSWGNRRTPLIPQERYKAFNISWIETPPDLFNVIPELYPWNQRYKYFRVMQKNREKTKEYAWKHIARGCDYVLHTDVDEIIDERCVDEFREVLGRNYDYVQLRFQEHNQYVNHSYGPVALYRVIKSSLPYTQMYKGAPRGATPGVIGWHLTNCFREPQDFWLKLMFASALPDFGGEHNVPSKGEIAHKIAHYELVHTGPDFPNCTSLSPVDTEWAPKYVRQNPGQFLWDTREYHG
jgi:hypothetical protein